MVSTPMTETIPNSPVPSVPTRQDAAGVDEPTDRPVLRAALTTVVALLVIACLGLGLLLGRHLSSRRDADSARADALASARQAILNLDALSAATIDRDLTRVVVGSTGAFRDSFSKAQKDLTAVVKERKTVSTGTVLSAGVVRADADTATVLVAVDRSIRDSSTPKAVVAHDRWRMSMELHGGRWLLADLQPVS